MRTNLQFQFLGDDGYEFSRGMIKTMVEYLTQDLEGLNLYLGINEAVCNALAYGKLGPILTEVNVGIRVNKKYIAVDVSSDSPGFDVNSYCEILKRQAEEMKGDDWAEALMDAEHGRGFWLMLTGADKVIYNEEGTRVILVSKIPVESSLVERDGKKLISKLFIKKPLRKG